MFEYVLLGKPTLWRNLAEIQESSETACELLWLKSCSMLRLKSRKKKIPRRSPQHDIEFCRRNHIDSSFRSKDMKIRKWWIRKGLRIAGEREKKRKKKKKKRRRAAECGSTGDDASSDAAPAKWWRVSPTGTRANRSEWDYWLNQPDPQLREAIRAWPSHVQPGTGIFSHAWGCVVGVWGCVGGSFFVRLPSVCPDFYFYVNKDLIKNNQYFWTPYKHRNASIRAHVNQIGHHTELRKRYM